jgi:Ni2+-binding GTPase involved in maturation of urease and hydrogenase
MKPLRFVMLGGFLGAGKTTSIARLARMFQERGQNIGIVTNDQAADLVDTMSLRSQGFDVGEVAGSCFCCNFGALTDTVEQLSEGERPDIILAEPVGSCTDLVATVVQPLVQLFDARFEVAPYGVILKPSHGRKILRGDKNGGFSPKAEYIFLKQLEEADFILINRTDELSTAEREELAALLNKQFPDQPVMFISAKSGEGFHELYEFLGKRGGFGKRILDLDYDVYAEGEAELGWLNASLTVKADKPWQLDDLLLRIVTRLRESLSAAKAEVAHLKAIGLWEGFYGVANLVSSDSSPELSLPSRCQATEAEVVVNARVAVDPVELEAFVRKAVEEAAASLGAKASFREVASFRPGRPQPTHRMTAAV